MAPCGDNANLCDGQILRGVTPQDELLIERLERRRHDAYTACVKMLAEREVPATLMEVEHLFDGQSLFFYFLGDTSEQLAALTNELAEVYEAQVQFRKFAQTLTEGCGPDCGTAGDCGGCSTCAVAAACKPLMDADGR